MRNIVTISLPTNTLKILMAEAREDGASRSDVIRRALKQHFFVRDFTKARKMALAELAKRDIALTEEEIFKKVS